MMRRIVAASAAAALFAAAPVGAAVASDLVVLESNVASLAPGSVVPATQSVSLGGGARIVMIAADGTTRSVSGPYNGAIGEAGSDAPGALERLTTSRDDSNHVGGAIRAPSWEQ